MKKFTDIIKGLDKYDTMLEIKKIYNTVDDEKFNEVKEWLLGGNKAEWLNIFTARKTCWKFFFEAAHNSFPKSKERIRELNKIMELETNSELTHKWR